MAQSEKPLHTLAAHEIAAAIASGETTCEKVARSCLARIAAREPVVKAWAFLDPEQVVADARAIDQHKERGPLHGVPVGIKDIIDTADMPTEMGSPIYRGHQPFADASCVSLLRSAGALILGKTATCEFAGATATVTTNPHNPAHTPGGSSSGSGAAVADFMVPAALGTQTGGSVQRPSSFCGTVGYKPTFGIIDTTGVKPAANSLDTVGLLTRSVEDAELLSRVLTNSTKVAWSKDDAKLRVGLSRTYAWDSADPATRDAVEDAARRLAQAGIAVKDVTLPSSFGDLIETREIINDYERARGMAFEWRTARDTLSPGLAKTIENGLTITRERYADAQIRVERLRRELDGLFADADVWLTPTVHGEAPKGLPFTGDHRFQSIWTQLHNPAVTLPTHAGPNGLPIGIQLVAPQYQDAKLLTAAQFVFRKLGPGPRVQV